MNNGVIRWCPVQDSAQTDDCIEKTIHMCKQTVWFYVMMNAARARVVNFLAGGGSGDAETLCDKFKILPQNLERFLEMAVREELLDLSSQNSSGVYSCVASADEIVRRLV